MGACATKPADLKVEGEAPEVLEDAAEKNVAGVAVAETEPAADGIRRRSLSDLLKENDESDVEAPEAEKKAEEPAAATADENGATEEQLAVEPSTATTEPNHTAEILELEDAHDAQVVEEEKRVDPDSVQNDETDDEAPEAEPEKKAEEPAAATADENEVTEEQLAVEPSVTTTEPNHTAEILEPEAAEDPQTHAQVVEEEKRVDPDSVQVTVVDSTESVEESKVVADAST
ncbi:cytochrome c1-like isoform X1 [Triticum dicoccoides]|uniref:cytochrome c1-like isoform X1 n=1 Tax=Triticum dicoccoides TaxID=85692 RepID=UPI000E7AB28B|nr:cytochrome c1-like isoform X1 [Triticum dicoccoides]